MIRITSWSLTYLEKCCLGKIFLKHVLHAKEQFTAWKILVLLSMYTVPLSASQNIPQTRADNYFCVQGRAHGSNPRSGSSAHLINFRTILLETLHLRETQIILCMTTKLSNWRMRGCDNSIFQNSFFSAVFYLLFLFLIWHFFSFHDLKYSEIIRGL